MGEHPRPHEEAELELGLAGVRCVHMYDAARCRAASVSDATMTKKRLDELVEKRRLADADLEGHRTRIIGRLAPVSDQTTV
jgi:hypothetical protein